MKSFSVVAGAAALAFTFVPAFADAPAADKTFANKAAAGGLAEVQLGQLAAQNAASANVKAFGQRMVTDHSKANDELMAIAKKQNLVLPTAPDAATREMMTSLQGQKGGAFDQAYVQHMVADHRKDVEDFQHEARQGKDPALKNFAQKYLPVLKQHLSLAESLQQNQPK